jgi:hypothetical protein
MELTLHDVAPFEGCVQACDGVGHGGLPDQTAVNIRERAGRRKQKPVLTEHTVTSERCRVTVPLDPVLLNDVRQ